MMNVPRSMDSSNLNSIMVIAEHPAVIEGMKCIIQSTMSIKTFLSSHSLCEARNYFHSSLPNIVIIDTIFGKKDVLEFIQWLRVFNSQIKILILTDNLDDKLCVDAFKTGARGCFLKKSSPEEIKHSLLMVQEGRILLDESFVNVLVNMDSSIEESVQSALNSRDIDILNLVAQGSTNQDISNRIFISSRTVQGHLSKIFVKLGVKTRTEAVSKAIQLGILKQTA